MKLEDNKNKTISLRLSVEDYKYLSIVAYMGGMTISKYLRTLASASINAVKLNVQQGKIKIEDFETIFDNQL